LKGVGRGERELMMELMDWTGPVADWLVELVGHFHQRQQQSEDGTGQDRTKKGTIFL
jgi:hypothetical protein